MTNQEQSSPYRLPRNVLPTLYDVRIRPDLDPETFAGTVTAYLTVSEPVDHIVLNAKELDIASATISRDGQPVAYITSIATDADLERVTLTLSAQLGPGDYELEMAFSGTLNRRLEGFYLSTFTDEDGVEQKIATTQFESTDARMAFPCWDEPDIKAEFDVALTVPSHLFAVSNGPIISATLSYDGSERTIRFGRTMKMSTYLLAFVVGPFEATEPVDVDGTPLRVVYPIGRGHLAAYALRAGEHGLRFFNDYYGIPYPSDKLDLVAVPDFAFGAMENLGCVTFREAILLVDEDAATQPELLVIADVIAHELAHMWFGDLVTMSWWNGIWLNEAFATFMAAMCTDAFNPDWQRWNQFSLERSAAFDVDSLASTRPIEYEVNSPADADGMFDLLTYEKGGSVLRMLEQHLGAERFRDGIRRYLAKHQYANTETSDLWDALEEETGEPVRSTMDAWIYQRGFPIISVSGCDHCEKVIVKQRRFLYSEDEYAPDSTIWPVPLGIRFADSDGDTRSERRLMTTDDEELESAAGATWINVNAGAHGFYRVNYAPNLLAALRENLQELLPIERYSLADDQWSAMLAGHASSMDYMELAQGYRNDDDLDVWTLLTSNLASLERMLRSDDALAAMRQLLADLYRSPLAKLGWQPGDNDTPRQLELRGVMFRSLATTARDPEALEEARRLHDAYLDGAQIEPNILAAATAAVAVQGTDSDYQTFVGKFKDPATPQEERRYRGLLASFPTSEQMESTLELCINGEVRSQDAPYLMGACLGNRHNGWRAWEFLASNWDAMLKQYPANSIVRMVGGIRALSLPDQAHQVREFFNTHKAPTGELTLKQHLERLEVNVAFRQRETARLEAWINKDKQDTAG